ncbi:M48 family metallopeptidase [Lysobacter brunescens]|uniref:M48 family metallopeptidase n=1 Tax=Lysobacter brunescens TaxID=262323 RepID=A0ABW2YDI0_9GAMM
MNFFERQATARRASFRLVLLFSFAVLGIVCAIDLVVWIALAGSDVRTPAQIGAVLVAVSVLTVAVIGLGSLYRIASLRGGGAAIALQMGGTPVPEQSRDPQLRRLRNVVEEISIASGVPMPQLYVLEHEAGINAFAAGYTPADAAVAVTRGALERLNRDELQGVIAHEFSHVLNGDMRLNIRLIGVLFGILMIALIGRRILEHGRFGGRGRDAAAVVVAALVAMAIGYLGLFFGRMIKAGVSRSRELLADASAVQFTRQTTGLAGALKKIAGLHEGAKLEHAGDAEEVSHMLFGDGVGLRGLFATHPPLLQRIQALEPGFGSEQLGQLSLRWRSEPPHGLEEDLRLGLAGAATGVLPPTHGAMQVAPALVAAQVAQPQPDDYRRADIIAAQLPEALRALAAQREDVVTLVLALLLDADASVRDRQHAEIAARLGRDRAVMATALRDEHLVDLHPMLRLPLASLCFPVLCRRPRPEMSRVLDAIHAAVNADARVSVFEYCLGTLLRMQVRASLDPSRQRQFGRRRIADARREIATLLSVVARAGHDDGQDAQRAYLAGMQRVLPRDDLDLVVPSEGVTALEPVWPVLDALEPHAKQLLVEAVTAAVSHDGRIGVAESELLRTVCAVLHCPLPPVLERG